MIDPRLQKLARILVEHSASIQAGDRVAIEATTVAEPLVRALIAEILKNEGYAYPLLSLQNEEELLFTYGNEKQLSNIHPFREMAYEQFESRIRISSSTNTRALSNIDASRQKKRQEAHAPILRTQMIRGAEKTFKWVSTLYPTAAYAMEAEMGILEFEDFVFSACHADPATSDPVSYWQGVKLEQQEIVDRIEGHDQIIVRGSDVDLSLSIKGRKFRNSYGKHNMPDGEIYTSPVEDSVSGWVRYTYPAIYAGRVVEGVELTFENGKVIKASAKKNQDFLLEMLETDTGARFVGEFAIGTNYHINRFTGIILFDEKIGGTFHMALGAGYPETGSQNKSKIHWDMICDLHTDSEILVDGEIIYRNGIFV
ncbi:MAG: aminopeptidase [Anaerolineales bacterium]